MAKSAGRIYGKTTSSDDEFGTITEVKSGCETFRSKSWEPWK